MDYFQCLDKYHVDHNGEKYNINRLYLEIDHIHKNNELI